MTKKHRESVSQRLNVGLIGLGEVAQLIHLPILEQLADRYRIAALCDLSPQLVKAMGERYRVDRLYLDAHELITQDDLDLVFVLNSDEYHADCVIDATRHQKHVFVEKPLCFTLREVDAILAAQQEARNLIMVGYMRRFAPAFLQGVQEVKRLGSINYARIRAIIGQNPYFIGQVARALRFSDLPAYAQQERAERFSALMTEATGSTSAPVHKLYHSICGLNGHDLSAMRELLGTPRAVLAAVQGPGQFVTAIFAYDGYHATFETGVDHQGRFDAHLEVLGETETVRIQYTTPYLRHLPTRLFLDRTTGDAYQQTEIRPTFKDPYTCELEALYDYIHSGETPKTSPQDFKEDLQLFQQIMQVMQLRRE